MNPVIHWVVAHTVARRLRRCPNCGHSQKVSSLRVRDPVTCDRCGTVIPVPPAARR